MTGRPRRLNPTRRALTADWLRALADELEAPYADQVQALLVVAADPTGPATASGTAPNGGTGSSSSSPVERAAAKFNPVSTRALALLLELELIGGRAQRAYVGLTEYAPNRPVAMCPYGHPLTSSSSRCTWIDPDTKARCGTRADTERRCDDCGQLETNVPASRLQLVTFLGRQMLLCHTHRQFRRRNGGKPPVSIARLARDAAELVADDGTYTEAELLP